MITPSFGLTATERVLPKLALDFTTASLDPRITFTRALATATVTNSSGVIVGVAADTPRFDYNPVTLACKGLLIEETRTNVLVNSLINGTSLSTQSVTTTAVAHTLSFYGTGNIVLSGTSSGTVTGTGVYPSRKTFTFTPTAGTLTLTITGSVQYAQLEVGAFATSFIPTTTAQTRNADVATMTGTNFSSWFDRTHGALYTESDCLNFSSNRGVWGIGDPTLAFGSGEMMYVLHNSTSSGALNFNVFDNGAQQTTLTPSVTPTVNIPIRSVFAFALNNFGASVLASAVSSGAGSLPTPTAMSIGSLVSAWNGGSQYLNGHVRKISYYAPRLVNAEVQAFSK